MLIFDMDGTLTDSNAVWKQVDIGFLRKRNLPYTQEYYEGVAHTTLTRAAVFVKDYCHLTESCEEIIAEWMDMAGDAYAVQVQAKPFVKAYLEHCRRAGQRMVVLTSAVPEHCYAALEHLGLRAYFEQIFLAQELDMDKSDPATYVYVAQQMGERPENCTMFDDSVAACRSAKAAGMTAIGIYDEFFHVAWEEMNTVCDKAVHSFEELL